MELVKRGAKLITGCRDLKKAADVVKIVKEKFGVDIKVEKLDLADLDSVRKSSQNRVNIKQIFLKEEMYFLIYFLIQTCH